MNEEQKQALVNIYEDLFVRSKKDKTLVNHVSSLQSILGIDPPSPFEEMKALLKTKQWPVAVNPNLICDQTSDEDKDNRAEGIIEILIEKNLLNKKFLDVGCGEGHVAQIALKHKAVISVGHDLKKHPNWDKIRDDRLVMTTDFSEVEKHGPFDTILIYDVLDHMDGGQLELLEKIRDITNPTEGEIYVRCHPWCSRHATHNYHEVNKAYIHLVFTEDELKQMGLTPEPNAKIVHPIGEYKKWFTGAGLKIKHESIMREKIEPFFANNEEIRSRIQEHWSDSPNNDFKTGKTFPSFQLEQQFLDFVLAR